jgi:hypothetical protein
MNKQASITSSICDEQYTRIGGAGCGCYDGRSILNLAGRNADDEGRGYGIGGEAATPAEEKGDAL